MALDAGEAKEMILEIMSQIDYDIYKEVLRQHEDFPEEWNLIDDCMRIVAKYVKVNP